MTYISTSSRHGKSFMLQLHQFGNTTQQQTTMNMIYQTVTRFIFLGRAIISEKFVTTLANSFIYCSCIPWYCLVKGIIRNCIIEMMTKLLFVYVSKLAKFVYSNLI